MRSVWWEVRCDRHGKSETARPMKEKVVKTGEPNGKSPLYLGCPICAKENRKKK